MHGALVFFYENMYFCSKPFTSLSQLWSLTAKGLNNPRPVWMSAQATIEARTPYRIILEGSASNGGFAVDDIKFQPLACASKTNEIKKSYSNHKQLVLKDIYMFLFSARPASAQPIQNET